MSVFDSVYNINGASRFSEQDEAESSEVEAKMMKESAELSMEQLVLPGEVISTSSNGASRLMTDRLERRTSAPDSTTVAAHRPSYAQPSSEAEAVHPLQRRATMGPTLLTTQAACGTSAGSSRGGKKLADPPSPVSKSVHNSYQDPDSPRVSFHKDGDADHSDVGPSDIDKPSNEGSAKVIPPAAKRRLCRHQTMPVGEDMRTRMSMCSGVSARQSANSSLRSERRPTDGGDFALNMLPQMHGPTSPKLEKVDRNPRRSATTYPIVVTNADDPATTPRQKRTDSFSLNTCGHYNTQLQKIEAARQATLAPSRNSDSDEEEHADSIQSRSVTPSRTSDECDSIEASEDAHSKSQSAKDDDATYPRGNSFGAGRASKRFSQFVPWKSVEVETLSEDGNVPLIFSTPANVFFGGLILLNALYIGIETDCYALMAPGVWLGIESVFLFFFVVEIVARWWNHGDNPIEVDEEERPFHTQVWNILDLLIVIMGITDTWVMTFLQAVDLTDTSDAVGFFGLLRMLRVFRLLRILRLFRFLQELMLLAQGIVGAMKALVWAVLLVSLFLYAASIFTTTMIGKKAASTSELETWFGSVFSSLLTLFQLMTLEGWDQVVRSTMDEAGVWTAIFFVVFVMFTNMVLLNLVTGVILENVLQVARKEEEKAFQKEEAQRLQTVQKIHRLFETVLGELNSGQLSLDDFTAACTNPKVIRQLDDLQIAHHEARELFVLMDTSRRGYIDIDHFIEGCLRIRGDARAKHLLGVQYDVQKVWTKLSSQLDDIEDRVLGEVTYIAGLLEEGGRHSVCRTDASQAGVSAWNQLSPVAENSTDVASKDDSDTLKTDSVERPNNHNGADSAVRAPLSVTVDDSSCDQTAGVNDGIIDQAKDQLTSTHSDGNMLSQPPSRTVGRTPSSSSQRRSKEASSDRHSPKADSGSDRSQANAAEDAKSPTGSVSKRGRRLSDPLHWKGKSWGKASRSITGNQIPGSEVGTVMERVLSLSREEQMLRGRLERIMSQRDAELLNLARLLGSSALEPKDKERDEAESKEGDSKRMHKDKAKEKEELEAVVRSMPIRKSPSNSISCSEVDRSGSLFSYTRRGSAQGVSAASTRRSQGVVENRHSMGLSLIQVEEPPQGPLARRRHSSDIVENTRF